MTNLTTKQTDKTKIGKLTAETAYGKFDIILDRSVPEDTVYVTNTANWYRNDTYKATIKSVNRFKTAWRALFKGEVKLDWTVPSNKKDKRLHITGKKEGWL